MKITKSTFLALVLLSPMAANADVLTFDSLGDGMEGNSRWDTIYDTSEVDVQLVGSVCSWEHGFGDLTGGAYACNRSGFVIIDFFALSDSTVYVDSFDWANWQGNGYETGWAIYDLADGLAHDGYLNGEENVYLANSSTSHETVNLGYGSTTGLRLQIDPDIFDNGIDNVTFRSVSSVSEPGTLALFGIGLFGMGLARRRKVSA